MADLEFNKFPRFKLLLLNKTLEEHKTYFHLQNSVLRHIRFTLLLTGFLHYILLAAAQNGFSNRTNISCGTTDIMNDMFQKNFQAWETNLQIERQLSQFNKSSQQSLRPQALVTLPVVVHIIHNNGPENISDTRALTAIQHLNEAFANTGYYNPVDGVNTNIQFCLAQRDPNGNPTNGITRNVSAYTNMNGPSFYSDDQNVKNINRWNPKCYINIWIVNSIPGAVAGYAYMPSAHGGSVDGIIIEASFFGNSYSSDVVAIHEMGHYFGLYHTFEGGCNNVDCLSDGDKVCDTPPDNSTAYISCSIPVNSCTTDTQSGFTSDQNDLTSDYMDYGNWDCMTVFTQGQADRMNWMINNVRGSLLNCRSCLPPCPNPVMADFNNTPTTINVGGSVNFTNTSVNALIYYWYIDGIFQSSAPNFSNTFNTVGQYIMKLVAIGNNTTLCDSSSKEVTVIVSCPVTADFTTTAVEIPVGQVLNFVNTSTGSPITNTWYINNVQVATTQNFSNQFNIPGIFTVSLVAGTALCNSSRTITVNVTTPCDPNNYFEKLINSPSYKFTSHQTIISADSTIIVLGTSAAVIVSNRDACTIMKLSKNGNLIWARHYYDGQYIAPHRIIQLNDGNYLVAGLHRFANSNHRPFLMKLDANGSIIWQKSFYYAGFSNFYFSDNVALTEASSGDIILGMSFQRTLNQGSHTFLSKYNSSGDLQWSKEVNNIWRVKNFALKNNSLYATFESYFPLPNYSVPAYLAKVDINTGGLSFAKKYDLTISGSDYPILKFRNLALLNDQLKLYGTITAGGGISDTGSHIFATIDTFGTIQSLKRIRFTDPLVYNGNVSFNRFGNILRNGQFIALESCATLGTLTPQKVFIHHSDQSAATSTTTQILSNFKTNLGYNANATTNKDNFKDRGNGNLLWTGWATTTISPISLQGLIVRSSDYSGIVSNNCPTQTGPHTYLANIVGTFPAPELALSSATFVNDPSLLIQDSSVQFNIYNICSAAIPVSCYSLKIDSPDTLCILQDSVNIICHRNPGCNEAVNWSISAPAQNSFRQVNDTTIRVKFPFYGNFAIAASFSSCSSISDTVQIFITKDARALSLGPDKSLCSFSTSVINAGSGYKSYKWYNGSTDSTNTINDAGEYYVTVEDYCNNIFSDTIKFNVVAAPTFDLGLDKTICGTDTLTITATAGFTNYNWAANYNINSITGQTVKVWPRVDTVYTATAIFNNNCTVLDSILITVKQAQLLNLGNDTSFCKDDSVHLDAGPGFVSYLWNTSAVTPAITVYAAGIYSIETMNASGCISKDTFRVLNVFPKPEIYLGGDTSICKKAPLLLTPGTGFTDYLWQDNTHSANFSANDIGLYWVTVTNTNGCKNTDSLRIIAVLDTPHNFIKPSYEVCNNGKSFVKASTGYTSYLWSVGGIKDSVAISHAGTYWLQVNNSDGCSAKEFFIVQEKKCIEGVYLPNAFSPNGDAVNPVFKALVYENLEFFSLTIYNRYGQQLFHTNDYTKGWDGTWKGKKQDVGAYAWICSYRLISGISDIQKGTVLLLR